MRDGRPAARRRAGLGLDTPSSVLSVAALALFVVASAFSIDTSSAALIATKDAVVRSFDWRFVATATGVLLGVAAIGLHPAAAKLRLGADDETPDFSRLAGLADHRVPLGAPRLVLLRRGRARDRHLQLSARSPAHAAHRTHPALGERWVDRWPGLAVDLVALFGTVCGVATSIGLAAAGMNATLNRLIGIGASMLHQIAIVCAVCTFGVVSALSGVSRGIRWLSEPPTVLPG